MKKIYIYPSRASISNSSLDSNPYMDNLHDSLLKTFNVVNIEPVSRLGQLFDVFKYLHLKIDYIYFNWIESVAGGRLGIIQYFLYYLLMFILKCKNVKVIYLLHNKMPHDKNKLSKKIMQDIIHQAHFVLSHSSEGITLVNDAGSRAKTSYVPHPISTSNLPNQNMNKDIDVLLWGTIHPYKAVDVFLENLKTSIYDGRFNVSIVGKIPDNNFQEKLMKYKSELVSIENRIPSMDEVRHLIDRSKIVLFTYQSETVLSSGALMDSFAFGANVLGPNTGAFRDLEEIGLIHTYENENMIIEKILKLLSLKEIVNRDSINSFIEENLWKQYGLKLKKILDN